MGLRMNNRGDKGRMSVMVIGVNDDLHIADCLATQDIPLKKLKSSLHRLYNRLGVEDRGFATRRCDLLTDQNNPVFGHGRPETLEQSLHMAVLHVGRMNFIRVGVEKVTETLVHTPRFTSKHEDRPKMEGACSRCAILIEETQDLLVEFGRHVLSGYRN